MRTEWKRITAARPMLTIARRTTIIALRDLAAIRPVTTTLLRVLTATRLTMAIALLLLTTLISCNNKPAEKIAVPETDSAILIPVVITDTVPNDSDDPAVWINYADPAASLVIGTDKDSSGGLYVFDLKGKLDTARSIQGLGRPNNVDIEYGLVLAGKAVDIAVTTERFTHKLRIYRLPDMTPVDNGGIPIFEGEAPLFRDLMGISLYKDPSGNIYAIAGRKTGPTDNTYLWQYLLKDDGKGNVKAELVRKFGNYSGKKEIEAIAVDDALEYIYYSDEQVGVRKYYAEPSKGNQQLALFADSSFAGDHEGISIYNTSPTTGFIIVSDQQADQFRVYRREGDPGSPNTHSLLRTVKVTAHESDGSESVSVPLGPDFPTGIFVAMSDEKVFHYYRPEQILGDLLKAK